MPHIYEFEPGTKLYTGHHREARLDPLDSKPLVPRFATLAVPPHIPDGYAARLGRDEAGKPAWLVVPIRDYSVYRFDPRTGELQSQRVITTAADTSQLTLRPDETLVEPPLIAQHEAAVFKAGRWEVVGDYRGVWYDQENLNQHIIRRLGDTPLNTWTRLEPPATLQKPTWNGRKWVEDPEILAERVRVAAEREKARQQIASSFLKNADIDTAMGWIDRANDISSLKRALKAILALLWSLQAQTIKGEVTTDVQKPR